MSILDRLQTLIRAEWNAARPGGGQRDDLRRTVRDARDAYREQRTLERRLASEYEDLLDDAQRWEDRAVAALRKNDERLAREALRRKHTVDEQARDVRDALDRCRRELGDLRSALEALQMRAEAQRDRGAPSPTGTTRSPRYYGAPPSPPPARDASARLDARVDDTLGRIDEMSGRVDDLEASVGAELALDPLAEERALDARFSALDRERNLDELRDRAADDEGGDGGRDDDDALRRLRRRVDDA